MTDRKEGTVRIGEMTRREFREAKEAGRFSTCIIPTGAIDQHLEHIEMGHDTRMVTWIAEQVAQRLYPDVVVAPAMHIGISEHHMIHPGSMSAKPGSWLAVLFDAIESMVRNGCRNVLVLNGHGGNHRPVEGVMAQWKMYFEHTHPEAGIDFQSFWELGRAKAEAISTTGVPGHATEYETSMALHLFPDSVRQEAMRDQEQEQPLEGTAEKGERLVGLTLDEVTEHIRAMMAGENG